MTWDDEAVEGMRLIGTLSYSYMDNNYGAGGPQRKDVRRDAADRGGDYVIESGGDRETEMVPEWGFGSSLSSVPIVVPKDFVRTDYDVYRKREPKPVKSDDAQSQLLAGLDSMVLEDYYGAIGHYDRAIALKADFAQAYAERGDAYLRKYEYEKWHKSLKDFSDLERALADYEKAFELGFEDRTVSLGIYSAASGLRQWEKALAALDRMLERSPQDAFLLGRRSEVRDITGDIKGALTDVTQAISLAEKVVEKQPLKRVSLLLYERGGQLKARSGDFPGAIADLTRAIDQCQWSSARDLVDRGDARYASGDIKGAMSDFDAVILIRAPLAGEDRYLAVGAQLRRALLKLQQGDPKGAIKDLERQVKSTPSVTHHAVALGMAYWAAGKEEDARAIWKWVLAPPEADRSKVDLQQACRYMARLLATSRDKKVRDPGRALKLVRSIAPDVKTALSFDLGTMAAAYAASGDPQRAAICQAQAAQNTPRRTPFARSVRQKRVALYRKGESLHLNPMEVFFDPGTGWIHNPD